jgi:pimeloyl-ACP methyl ester carboxylesterase
VYKRQAGRDGEPLRFIPRRWAEGQIALADHGPDDGTPLLLFHSNVSGRHMPASFIAALQSDGFRPMAIDRAGYGLTDPVDGDPVSAGVKDVIDALDALGIPTATVLARCTTASLVACAAAQTGRVTGGVLLWPDPPPRVDRLANRMSHMGRRIYREFPRMGAAFAKMICNRTSADKMEATWRKACEGIAVDLAIMDDDQGRADIIRGSHQAIHGRLGFVNEALALGDGPQPIRVEDATRWTAMFGEGYERFDVPDAMAFWGDVIPGGTVQCVERGVHFLHMTNTAEVREALRRAR